MWGYLATYKIKINIYTLCVLCVRVKSSLLVRGLGRLEAAATFIYYPASGARVCAGGARWAPPRLPAPRPILRSQA